MTVRRLILNWQVESTREILPVAELIIQRTGEEERFEFGYLEGAREACGRGFQPLMAFPDLDRRYASGELFPFFRNRVLPSTRPDYLDYLAALNLDADTADHVELLGRGHGRRQTDRIETVLAAERDVETGRYVTRFLARGVRHVESAEEAIRGLQADDRLETTLEADNPHNPRARMLRTHGVAIGYVPDYLLADLDVLDVSDAEPQFVVERVNPPPQPAHHRLLVRLEARWPTDFEPFAAPVFQRYRARQPLLSRQFAE